ncbi:MAG: DUF2095 family protein [Candidatus Helarchaeota archaeon]
MVEEDEEEFKRKYPHLSEELVSKNKNIAITSIRSEDVPEKDTKTKNKVPDELRNPDVISFIRRADTEEQAIEIINFCLKNGDINEDYANELKLQLTLYGVRSFGAKKEPGYYEKKYRSKQRKS